MAKKIEQEHGGVINNWEKGESGNPKGRPRKYVSLLKEQGYKLSEINDSIQAMMSMTIEEVVDANTAKNVLFPITLV